MKVILLDVLLASTIFFSSIEPSSQSSSSRSTERISPGRRSGSDQRKYSHSVEESSEHSEVSSSSRISGSRRRRPPAIQLPSRPQWQQESLRRTESQPPSTSYQFSNREYELESTHDSGHLSYSAPGRLPSQYKNSGNLRSSESRENSLSRQFEHLGLGYQSQSSQTSLRFREGSISSQSSLPSHLSSPTGPFSIGFNSFSDEPSDSGSRGQSPSRF